MAVEPSPSGFHDGLLEGLLRITEQCVSVVRDAQEYLLVWPSNESGWNRALNAIEFTDRNGKVTLADGEDVSLGGSDFGVNGPNWIDSVPWISPPDASCPTDIGWRVGAIRAD
jgi:hypothetical protein